MFINWRTAGLEYFGLFPGGEKDFDKSLEGELYECVLKHLETIELFIEKYKDDRFYGGHAVALGQVRDGILKEYMEEIGNELIELYEIFKYN